VLFTVYRPIENTRTSLLRYKIENIKQATLSVSPSLLITIFLQCLPLRWS